MNYEFASDNTAPAAPEVLAALVAANEGTAFSYGADLWTDELREAISLAFERETPVEVVPILSGKLANHLSLASITEPGGKIFCHVHAHIYFDEFGGPAYITRCELIGLDGELDKLTPEILAAALTTNAPVPPGSALSFTNATECGTLYSPDEIRALADFAHVRGLLVHLDGARISNAAVALGCSFADLTWRAGVDVVSFGATKNGGLCAEAVLAFKPEIAERLRAKQELLCHFPSKMRFLSSQLTAWLANDGWKRRAERSNLLAKSVRAALVALPEVELAIPVETNMIFVRFTEEMRARLDTAGYSVYAQPQYGDDVIRFVSSWSTTEESVERLISALA